MNVERFKIDGELVELIDPATIQDHVTIAIYFTDHTPQGIPCGELRGAVTWGASPLLPVIPGRKPPGTPGLLQFHFKEHDTTLILEMENLYNVLAEQVERKAKR